MITAMKKITVYGIQSQRKAVMETLQKAGAVEFQKSDFQDESLKRVDVADKIMQFDRYLATTKQALEILGDYAPEKTGLFSARKALSMDKYSMDTKEAETVGNDVFDIVALQKKIGECKMNIARTRSKIDAMAPWLELDTPMNFNQTKMVRSALYQLPLEADVVKVEELLGDQAEHVYIEIVDKQKDMTCIFLLYLKDEEENVEKAIREAGFVKPPFSLSHLPCREKINRLQREIADQEKAISEMEAKLITYGQKRDEIKLLFDHIQLRRDKYSALTQLQQTEQAFILEGFVPRKLGTSIKNKLEATAVCEVEISEVPADEEAPVLFENNGFAAPVEGITKTYSMPSPMDIDPNAIMAFFYYLFFGMMFSDAGYGILVVLVTGFITFFSKAEQHTKNTMKMFFFCGLSTTFWGVMYGSFFGNLISAVSLTFMGHEVLLKPLWIDPVKEPLTLLIFSVALGLIQILIGLGIKFYMYWRAGRKLEAAFDVGFWILFLLGVSVFAIGAGVGISLLSTVGLWMLACAAAGLVLTQGRDKKNIFGKLASGILSLYDVTSYVSDALSYSRLMALGLATGVIAQVVNTMGTLAGGGIGGAIVFVIIFIVGHAMNFAINMLGAYVHTNRLQYVEFFSKFYEGGGREFAPLKMNTKYYQFMEDERL